MLFDESGLMKMVCICYQKQYDLLCYNSEASFDYVGLLLLVLGKSVITKMY